ncbi:MAG: GHKL domain-containing protein [Chitinophagaceae bacterium]|nr:MAG: GHKL domain-containing protein [Chitinophagaceae bacterium]
MAIAQEGKRTDNQFGYMASLASAYQQSGQLDSAFKYAYYLQHNAKSFGYNSILASSSGILAKLFKEQKKYDSAVKYMALESSYKDSVTGMEALNSIQFLTSNYQLKNLERQQEKEQAVAEYKARIKNYFYAGGILLLLIVIAAMYRINKQRAQSKKTIEAAYNDLKATQAQLIQSEKMASLGELTAGIAHEIQNPLNFVNNFSDINKELMDELLVELNKGNTDEVKALANDVKDNEDKINHHGKRADSIVKGMLQHSRSSGGQKEPTDINALCDEYLRLSYHGLRAKDKSFNATLKTDFDASIEKVNIVPQDMGRVIMNLLTNAFYAVNERKSTTDNRPLTTDAIYEPAVSIRTKKNSGKIQIEVADNGNGIPQNITDKIFQPFFTTKPSGSGTGLGLSLSYDIVKAHNGQMKVESTEGKFTRFIITLPV